MALEVSYLVFCWPIRFGEIVQRGFMLAAAVVVGVQHRIDGKPLGHFMPLAKRFGDPTPLEHSNAESVHRANHKMVVMLSNHVGVATLSEGVQFRFDGGGVALVHQVGVPVMGVDHCPVVGVWKVVAPEPKEALKRFGCNLRIASSCAG